MRVDNEVARAMVAIDDWKEKGEIKSSGASGHDVDEARDQGGEDAKEY